MQEDIAEFHKSYLIGWSHIDFKRLSSHWRSNQDGAAGADVSFLCPNHAHVKLISTILERWGVPECALKLSKGQKFGGHTIALLDLETAPNELKDRIHEPFRDAILHHPIAFLRGYFDHQIIEGVPIHRGQRIARWTYDKIRMSFSSLDHIAVIKSECGLDTWKWDVFQATSPPHFVSLRASDALDFLSWIASENPPSQPETPFFGNVMIHRIVNHLRQTKKSGAITNGTASAPGFSVTLSVNRVVQILTSGNGIVYSIQTDAKLPEIKPGSPAQLILKPIAKTDVGRDFLDRCVMSSSPPEHAGEVRVLFTSFSGMGASVPELCDHLQLEVTLVNREWIIPCKTNESNSILHPSNA